NPRVVSRMCRKVLRRAPNASPLPEPCRLRDDRHIAAADAQLNRPDAVAQCVANLALDLALDRRVARRLGIRIFLVPRGRDGFFDRSRWGAACVPECQTSFDPR